MQLKSLGYRSDLIFTSFDGQVEDRGSYLVLRTLSNPNFFWGNLLIFEQAPRSGDFPKWATLFQKEFTDPRIYHKTFAWDSIDGEQGDISEFLAQGFELQTQVVLATAQVKEPPHPHPTLIVRPISGDLEWERMIEVQVASAHGNLPKHEWEKFYRSQSGRYRKMSQAGMGHWFGGFLEGQLVAGLGVFHDGEIGRFQIVTTHPDFARRGICGTLVYRAADLALREWKLKQLVMCADAEYHAARIYESVGFRPVEKSCGLSWWDRNREGHA